MANFEFTKADRRVGVYYFYVYDRDFRSGFVKICSDFYPAKVWLNGHDWGVSMERRIREINRFTVGLDGALLPRGYLPAVRETRQVATPTATADPRKEWKRPKTRYRRLRALGLPKRNCREVAASQKGYWPLAHSPHLQRAPRNAYW